MNCQVQFLENKCSWFVFYSTGGIADSYLSSLGIYKKLNCDDDDDIIYHNEESGLYLFRHDSLSGNWMVGF